MEQNQENEMREIDSTLKEEEEERRKDKEMCKSRQSKGCLPWIVWMRRRQREKHKPRRRVLFGNRNAKIEQE